LSYSMYTGDCCIYARTKEMGTHWRVVRSVYLSRHLFRPRAASLCVHTYQCIAGHNLPRLSLSLISFPAWGDPIGI
jgi:hypothetical protein